MPRTSKNKFEIINDEIHISKEGWPLIGLTTYREDYYEELTSKTWTLTKANSETDDKGYLSNKTLGTEDISELPDKDQLILVYCRSGNRSKQASEKLVKLGYTNIIEIGGINSWPGETVTGDK